MSSIIIGSVHIYNGKAANGDISVSCIKVSCAKSGRDIIDVILRGFRYPRFLKYIPAK